MTREEAISILTLYQNWNMGQKSTHLALGYTRTQEDDIYDERRELVLKATKVLKENKSSQTASKE
jgi:hypothetical protein